MIGSNIVMLFYLSGVIFATILLIGLSYYEAKVKKENIDDLPASILMVIGSWGTVALFIYGYRETLKKIFKKK